MELWRGGPRMVKESCAYPVGADSVLLADFAAAGRGVRLLDMGCGSGLIALLLLWREATLTADGIELDPAAAAEARANAAANGLAERFRVMTGDVRALHERDTGGRYDVAVANPPYFAADSGEKPADPARRRARSEEGCTLEELAAAAARLVKNGGRFCFVYRPERLAEALAVMRAHRLEPKRLRLVHDTVSAAPSAALIECRLGGGTGLAVEPPLVMKDADGAMTAEARRIYHRE